MHPLPESFTASEPEGAVARTVLVLRRRFLYVVDDQDLHWRLPALQLQSQLLLQRREEGRSGCSPCLGRIRLHLSSFASRPAINPM